MDIKVSEISLERKIQWLYDIPYTWNLKKKNKQIETETDSYTQRTNWWLPEVREVGDQQDKGKGLRGTNFQL